jgi:hypothetical protein
VPSSWLSLPSSRCFRNAETLLSSGSSRRTNCSGSAMPSRTDRSGVTARASRRHACSHAHGTTAASNLVKIASEARRT